VGRARGRTEYLTEVDAGLAAFDAARGRGETPPPYVFRISGSDTPPRYTCQAAQQSRLAELVHPNLLFELAFFYAERDGIGVNTSATRSSWRMRSCHG
jgi:hypothetical protein